MIMSHGPDIIVTAGSPPIVSLVVEVKQSFADLAAAEAQLKRYMFGTRCPLGMLVSAATMRLYRDSFAAYSPDSIELVGEFSMLGVLPEVKAAPATERAVRLEEAVQTWLEGLASAAARTRLPRELRDAIEEHVLPVLAAGEVRAAGPRWRRTGSDG
jgi:hypothetical protein